MARVQEGLRPPADDDSQGPPRQHRDCLSAPGAAARQPDGRDRGDGSRIVLVEGGAPPASRCRHRGAGQDSPWPREVILAGGVINTPQLLMLSGIGDPDELARARRSRPWLPLPGVGANLQDHVSVILMYRRSRAGTVPPHDARRPDRPRLPAPI